MYAAIAPATRRGNAAGKPYPLVELEAAVGMADVEPVLEGLGLLEAKEAALE